MEVDSSLRELERKLGWAAFFHKHGKPDRDEKFNPKLHVPSNRCAKTDPAVTRFMGHIRETIMQKHQKLVDTERYRRRDERNHIEECAEREIRAKTVVILESDKDGCWVTMSNDGYSHLENEILRSGSYEEVRPEQIQTRRIRDRYVAACKTLAKGSKNPEIKI